MSQMNFRRLIPLTLAVLTTSAELTVKEEEPMETVSQCILCILNDHFKDAKKIALRYDGDQRQTMIVKQLLRHGNNPIMVNANEYSVGLKLDDRIPSDVTIILNEDVNITKYLENNLYTASTVFFTIIWEKSEEILKKFVVFWDYNIVKAYALKVEKDEVHVYEYFPFVNCNISEPVLLDKWSENGFSYGEMNRIEEKYPVQQVNGCPLVVSVPNVPPTVIFPDLSKLKGSTVISGTEGLMWMVISEKINSTFTYKTPDDGGLWGRVVPKPGGAVGDIIHKTSHFAGGGPAATLERMTYLDGVVGTSGTTDLVVWAVPKGAGRSQPVWLGVYIVEFSLLTWICLALIHAFAVISYSAFSRFTRTLSTFGLFDSFLFLFTISLRGSVKMPRNASLKMFVASWMWYTLIIMTAYESAMRSTLTVPIRHKEVNTFREVIESGIDLYGVDSTISIVLGKENDPYEDAMAKKVKIWNSSMEEILKRIARDRNTGYMREKLTLDYFLFNHTEMIGSIHQVKQHLYIYYQSLFMSKRFPALHRIERVVTHLRESGIPTWWRSQFARESHPSQPRAVKLTMEHITAPFILLGVGTLTAAIALIAERIRFKKTRSRPVETLGLSTF